MLKTEASSQIEASRSRHREGSGGVCECVCVCVCGLCGGGLYCMDDVVLYYEQTGWLVHTALMT